MYSVLIVDDEIASIKYLRNLIAGYLPDFRVIQEAFSGQEAYMYLKEHPVDLMITDARMPGMDGIELSQRARTLYPELKIVVVSVYADFEYAKGAVSAGVNEYLLKPLNINRAIDVLRDVATKLDAGYLQARKSALAQLAAGKAVAPYELSRLFEGTFCRVGLIRIGNLPVHRNNVRFSAGYAPHADGIIILPGRDDMEWIGIKQQGMNEKLSQQLLALAQAHSNDTATVAYCVDACPLMQLHGAIRSLMKALDERLVIGKPQLIQVPPGEPAPSAELAINELRKLDFCIQTGNAEMLKDFLFSLAVDWEKQAYPQRIVEGLLWQIAERGMSVMPQAQFKRQSVRSEIDELFLFARNLGELMSGFWDVMFAPLQAAPRLKQQADELILEMCQYVKEHYTEPLTLQFMCVQFGISQTYLSRLFRRYEGTTFNEYLTSCRLDVAKHLIEQQPDAKLRDIARLCGYEDPSYFSKVFHQREGMTPQQYAAKQEQGPN